MLPYCLKCKKKKKKNAQDINPSVSKTSNGKIMLSKCITCDSKNQNL